MRNIRVLLITGAGLAGLVLGIWVAISAGNGTNKKNDDAALKSARAYFSKPLLVATGSTNRPILDYKGPRWTIVNLWATWCTPCREEMPEFVAFRKEFGEREGIEFVGIAIDRQEAVIKFLKDNGIDYPILMDDISAVEQTKLFGNERTALPFSYVLDHQGTIVQTKLGKLTKKDLLAIVSK